ncbi:hypothetical protein RRF57_011182 [Xylaria bambusicola]|uniref:Uncharacterized protein n=1 Tax=Xylaria bambusicola TaxID=326684 RepID=A0AAN7UMD4_9PEZI
MLAVVGSGGSTTHALARLPVLFWAFSPVKFLLLGACVVIPHVFLQFCRNQLNIITIASATYKPACPVGCLSYHRPTSPPPARIGVYRATSDVPFETRQATLDSGFCQPPADLTFNGLDNLPSWIPSWGTLGSTVRPPVPWLGVANGLTVFYFRRPYMTTKLRWSCRSAPIPTSAAIITVISWLLSRSLVDPYRSPRCKDIRCGRPSQWCPPRDLPDIQGPEFFHDALPPSTITKTHFVSFIQAVSSAAATHARTWYLRLNICL